MIWEKCKISRVTNAAVDCVIENRLPVVLACIRLDENYQQNITKLENISRYFSEQITVAYALEDMFTYFRDRYDIKGTPTYLILYEGRLIDAILGNSTQDQLIERILISLVNLQDQKNGDVHS